MKRLIRRVLCGTLSACVMLCAIPRARAARFADVPDSHWAAADIELCAQQGFMNGVTPTLFGVGNSLSRAACIVILSRFFRWSPADPVGLPYDDIQPSAWYATELAAAYQEGVMTEQNPLFRPEDPITRGEFAALLVRALGYQMLAASTRTSPFGDVSANSGYIALAYDMGLVNGNDGSFNPNSAATREQTAAILARLYRKLHGGQNKIGILSSSDGLWAYAGLDYAAIRAGTLSGEQGNPIRYQISQSEAASLRAAVTASGAKPLLYLTGDTPRWDALRPIADAVRSDGYAGLLLELTGSFVDISRFQSLRGLLQDRELHLIVPAPAQASEDYPYAALANLADNLTIRVLGQSRLINGFPSDPVEPLEEVYRTLRGLFRSAAPLNPSRCSLLLSTSGSAWTGVSNMGSVSGQQVETMLRSGDASNHYSERYACAYLRRTNSDGQAEVIWYPDSRSTAARSQLAKLFGVGGIVLSDVNGVTQGVLSALDP